MPTKILAEDLVEYLKRLREEHKLEPDASGAFSVVFTHPEDSNVMVKISAGDTGYMDFVRFCQSQAGNRWLPEILEVKKLELDTHFEVWAIFVPRLERASPNQVRFAFAKEIAPWIHDPQVFSERARLSFPEWKNVLRTSPDPELRQVAKFLITHFNRLDLLTQNFMMRKNQLVFNDPLSPIS